MSYLLCYRLRYYHSYDDETVWAFVQRLGGSLEMGGAAFAVDFYIPEAYEVMLLLKYPELERVRALDYIV